MNKDEQLSRLLRLKRHETPGQDYFAGFLHDFHAYQRLHAAAPNPANPANALGALARSREWWAHASQGLRRPALAWGALGAAASAALLLSLRPPAQPTGLAATPPAPPAPTWQSRQTPFPAAQTVPVSSAPRLAPPAPGKRRTSEQPQDLPNVIGPATPAAAPSAAEPARPQ